MQVSRKLVDVEKDIATGDLLLFRGTGWIARLIGTAGRTTYTHAGKAAWWGDMLFCCEVRELKGGRAVTLASQVKKYPGQIDVYRTNPWQMAAYDRQAAINYMRRLTGCDYGWWAVARATLLHLPAIRFLRKEDYQLEDDEVPTTPPFCSQACSLADLYGGGVDPVPNLPSRLTEPGDLARSSFYEYLFTLEGV